MRRLVIIAALAALTAIGLVAAPAQAVTVVADGGHIHSHIYGPTASGNLYENWHHLAIGKDGSTYTARWHGHCDKNGADYDGCRADLDLVLKIWTGQWTVVARNHIADPGGAYNCCNGTGWYANSATHVGTPAGISSGTWMQACTEDSISRIRLGDGSNVYEGNAQEACSGQYQA